MTATQHVSSAKHPVEVCDQPRGWRSKPLFLEESGEQLDRGGTVRMFAPLDLNYAKTHRQCAFAQRRA
jgi:hypothetical protein